MSQLTVDTTATWKQRLKGRVPPHLDEEIDIFETQIAQKRQGKIDDKVFAETRLRRGVYGQRYDNGQRHDGTASRALEYPCGDLTKGPNTVWDAPGMLRIKIPFGAMNGEQMEVLADLAEEYSDGIAHVTTRQDIQLHFIHIDDTPDIMRRLAAVGITTQEACGNSVRNVTACPLAGVCRDEPFDVSPYAHAMTHFLLGHRDAQDFGRKFKIAFSGCEQHACGLANMHDLGVLAQVRATGNGTRSSERGFKVFVGGGLGPVPHQAKVLREFVREDELLPLAQAVCRVFGRLGEKRNRARARIKFLVAKLGIEEFTRLVDEELAVLPADERWTAYLDRLDVADEHPTRLGAALEPGPRPEGFAEWLGTNVQRQRQPGYVTTAVNLPLGDLTSTQLRALADTARRFNGGLVRNTVEQNIVLRNVSEADLPALYAELGAAGLGAPGASSLVDVTSCPGTDTCKLGISSSRGLAGELRKRIADSIRTAGVLADEAVKDLRIKVSGCFNSCGQHHVADIGFYGVSRKSDGRTMPHFQVILGGQWTENAGSYGLAVVAVPSKRIPEVVERIAGLFVAEREKGESSQGVHARRPGRRRVRRRGRHRGRVRALRRRAGGLPGPARTRPGRCRDRRIQGLRGDGPGGARVDHDREHRHRQRAGRDRRRVPDPLLRHGVLLRSVRGRQVRELPVPRSRRRRDGLERGSPPADRGGPVVHRSGARLQPADLPGPGSAGGLMAADLLDGEGAQTPNLDGLVKFDLKVLAADAAEVEAEEFIPVFHRWITERVLPELLIDVADYSHVQRILTERAGDCPPGAERCSGGGSTGEGYWRHDVLGALIYATWTFLQRDGEVTHLGYNSLDRVEGHQLHLTNPDQSRTFVSIYMHENKLYVAEGTVPRGYPEPALFQQSLGWLDEDGNGLRYQGPYSNGFPAPPRVPAVF